MGGLHRLLLRPACAQGGARPAAGGGGPSSTGLSRLVCCAALLWLLGGTVALADSLTPAQYGARLRDVRSLLASGRLADARALLRRTTEIAAGDRTIAVDDGPIADRLAATQASIAELDAYIGLVDRENARAIDPAAADAAIRAVARDTAATAGSQSLIDAISRAIARFLSGLSGPRVDPVEVVPAVGGLGLAALVLVVAILGRGLRERVRSEVVLRDDAAAAREDPAAHLAAADRAIAEGRAREAVHALYLYALTSLAAREAIRYDPALTDRELLLRAAGIPHADALRDLVALYERAWFGVREPASEEARSARSLALRVAG